MIIHGLLLFCEVSFTFQFALLNLSTHINPEGVASVETVHSYNSVVTVLTTLCNSFFKSQLHLLTSLPIKNY